MNAESFALYLRNPSLLYQASYQELKSLSLLYPYCQNIHLLLLQKSYLDGLPEWGQNLHKAAAYSIDRTFLYHLMKQMDAKTPETDSFLLDEEYLELKSLAELDEEMALMGGQSPEISPASQSLSFSPTAPHRLNSSPEEDDEDDFHEDFLLRNGSAPAAEAHEAASLSPAGAQQDMGSQEEVAEAVPDAQNFPTTAKAKVPTPVASPSADAIHDAAAIALIIANLPLAAHDDALPEPKGNQAKPPLASPHLAVFNQPIQRASHRHAPVAQPLSVHHHHAPAHPLPKNSFTSWVEQFQPPHIQNKLNELMESRQLEAKRKKNKRKKEDKKAASLAGLPPSAIRSITENEEIATETLAEILQAQGFKDKAIEMYQRLMLVFPEKSSYFASKIENLKSN
jgi:hypothetical protein